MRLGMGVGIGLGGLTALLGASTAAGAYLGSEEAGLSIDFAQVSALVRGHTTNFVGDPTDLLTYTTTTPKMVYDSTGLLEWNGHNLLTYSNTFSNAAWTKENSTISNANAVSDPNGGTNASTLTANAANARLYASGAGVVGDRTIVSVWMKRRSGTGTVEVSGADLVYTNVTSAIASEWARVAAISVAGSAISLAVIRLVTSGDSVDVAFSQVEKSLRGTVGTTYLPTTTAARFALPLDYNPSTLAALGVLVEEQRTNLALRSAEIDNAAWISIGVLTVTANSAASPDGTTTAELVSQPNVSTNRRQVVTVLGSTTYTASVWVKAPTVGAATHARLTTNNNVAWSTGGSTKVALTSSWQRISVTYTTGGGDTAAVIQIGRNAVDGADDPDTSGDVLVWGFQIEAGVVPTSYIPTTSAQVTRAGDAITLATSAFPFSATAGAMAMELSSDLFTNAHFWNLSDGTANERITSYCTGAGGTNSLFIADGGAAQAAINAAGAITSGAIKTASAWALNDIAHCRDAGTVVTDAAATLPTVNVLKLFTDETGGAFKQTGWIKRLKYIPRRASNAELQAFTT